MHHSWIQILRQYSYSDGTTADAPTAGSAAGSAATAAQSGSGSGMEVEGADAVIKARGAIQKARVAIATGASPSRPGSTLEACRQRKAAREQVLAAERRVSTQAA